MTDDALSALKQYHWPGNVRELRNLVERVLILNPKTLELTIEAALKVSFNPPPAPPDPCCRRDLAARDGGIARAGRCR